MSIPIVIFHVGCSQEYFKNCVTASSKNNIVYLIGDDSNKDTFSANPKVTFFHINDLENDGAQRFKNCFTNYSNNNHSYELFCFLRVFYIKALFDKTKLDWLFHTDSDCVILENVNEVFGKPTQIAFSLQKMENKFHMVGSIHNAMLNVDFCDKFVELCFDIYENKSKFDLIGKKIDWHKTNKIPGGICDMTLYYLLDSEKIIKNIIDLNEPFEFRGKSVIFDHNISDSYGFDGDKTYAKQNGIKILKLDGSNYYFTRDDKKQKQIQTLSIHFQGAAKRILSNFYL